MFYNRVNIGLINAVLNSWRGGDRRFSSQTSSRRNGNFLDCVRLYDKSAEKGRPKHARHTLRFVSDFQDFLDK